MRKSAWIILTGLVAGGCSHKDAANLSGSGAEPVKVEDVARDYASLKRMTKEPVSVDARLAALCTTAGSGRAQVMYGPHAHTAVMIYMNDVAAEAFVEKSGAYPAGSVIVKEKRAEYEPGHSGVGGMIKRSPGYDPGHGDWEYFYFENAAKIDRGKIESCEGCHSAAANRDYVFGGWGWGN